MAKKKKPKQPKIHFIYNDLYDFNTWFFWGWTREEMHAYLLKKHSFTNFSSDPDPGGAVIILPLVKKVEDGPDSEATVYCLWLPEDCGLNVVAHEAFHITSRALRSCGLELNHGSEEAFAYLLSWIVHEVVTIIET